MDIEWKKQKDRIMNVAAYLKKERMDSGSMVALDDDVESIGGVALSRSKGIMEGHRISKSEMFVIIPIF